MIKDIIQITKNTKNRIFAIPAADPAIPPNPNTAAIIAMTKNTSDQCNIISVSLYD